MTRNLWVQRGTAIVQWRARIQRDVATPEVALRLLERCADAGRRHGMFVCDTDPVDYERAAWARENQLRLSLEDADAAADLWWYGSSDAKVHGLVRDLGALLEALPEGAQKIDPDYRAEGPSPVNIWGSLVDHDDPREHLTLFVSLYSDIWMPYVKGLAHPNYTENAYFDNTELATSHTPRFNAFLSDIAAALRDTRAQLVLDNEDGVINSEYLPWVHDGGIRLDGPEPALVPPHLHEWKYSDEDGDLESG
jgi:hypothetical protein